MQESTRAFATELIREPVKEAVREALDEEAKTVSSQGGETVEASERQPSSQTEQEASKSGRSRGRILGVIAAIVGIAYLARRRMSSTTGSAWTEPSSDAITEGKTESGYVPEGEMQTAGADEETEGTGPSSSTRDQ